MDETDSNGLLEVLLLDIGAWCHDHAVVPIASPIPLASWLHVMRHDPTVEYLAFVDDSTVGEGGCSGGRVVAVDTYDGRQYFAVPGAALPLLFELMAGES